MTEGLVKYHRRMPHWRLVGSVYFVTWRLAPSQAELSAEERGVIMAALDDAETGGTGLSFLRPSEIARLAFESTGFIERFPVISSLKDLA